MKDEIKEILDKLKDKNNYISHSMILLSIKETTLILDYITNLQEENEKLKRDNEIYKLRHNNAIKKLSSAINHYNLEDKNNTILFVKEILEGNDISEKSYRKLNGGE